ncbi:MAG: DUF1501 domain-containing protein [Bacteroidia bacterium]|nr:DUF1501 domain-containing protein [Bacteroidia bacterium]
MKRSTFLKTAGAALVPLTLTPAGLDAKGQPKGILSRLAALATNTDHVLVLIDLAGGNDGLNTVIPIDQYSNLSKARGNVMIPQNKILSLNGTLNTGLHPSLTGLQQLYNNGKLKIIQNVGYPQQNFSHFRSQDIWFSASDSTEYLPTGFAGRYLNLEYPGFPTNYPNVSNPDPLGIQVGSLLSLMFMGPVTNMGMAISYPKDVFSPTDSIPDTAPTSNAGTQLTYVRTISSQTAAYNKVIKAAATKITTQKPYPNSELGKQLKVVSQLIAGGLQTRVYMVGISGFDTHSNQVDKSDTTKGNHANLLKEVGDAIAAFQADIEFQGVDSRVLGMTISEFGRRIKSNDSVGTDHGASAPMFVFGTPVDGGKILGTNPVIASNVGVEDNLTMQYDFRSIYSTIIKDWFCLSDEDAKTVMLKDFNFLPLIKNGCSVAHVRDPFAADPGLKCYPNPFGSRAEIVYDSSGYQTKIDLIDTSGRIVKNVLDEHKPTGRYKFEADMSDVPPGIYYLSMRSITGQMAIPVQKAPM